MMFVQLAWLHLFQLPVSWAPAVESMSSAGLWEKTSSFVKRANAIVRERP